MGILQARILEWVAMPSSRDLPNPAIELRSPALQVDSLPSELPRKLSSFLSEMKVAQLVKDPPAMQETPVRFPGWEGPLEKG